MQDGSLVTVMTSDHDYDELQPLKEGYVRAEIHPSGFILIPQKDGTLIRYLAHVITFPLFLDDIILSIYFVYLCGVLV